ncbi:GNAT family N-acetyltransferase [Mycobacterium sp. CBMA271]|nr:GNAT family N-acetyltransferase [Mycobacteroides sp. CBMA 326]MUM23176.1 GNAT family N-acetyltransferase [Mycobacteroides sp. CBMA 271]
MNAAEWVGRPTLEGVRVRLVPLALEDATGLAAAVDRPVAFEWTVVPRDVPSAQDYITAALNTPDRFAFSVTDRRSGKIVGTTSFYDINAYHRSLAIGATFYSAANHGDGVNPETKYLLLQYAFEQLDAVRVVFHTDERNEQSRAAILKLGTTFEGVLRKQFPRPDGTWRTTAQYSLIDDDWPNTKGLLQERIRS